MIAAAFAVLPDYLSQHVLLSISALVLGLLIERQPIYLLNALAFLALDIGAILLLLLAQQLNEDVWSVLVTLAY